MRLIRIVLPLLICAMLVACSEPGPKLAPTPRAYIAKPLPTPQAPPAAGVCDASVSVQGTGGPNLVPNPSFEAPSPLPHLLSLASEVPREVDTSVAHSGRCSMRLVRSLDGDCVTLCGYWTDPIDLIPGKNVYTLSVYFKVDPQIAKTSGIFVTVRVPDGQGGWVPVFGKDVPTNADGWSVAVVDVVVAPLFRQVVLDIAWLNHIKSSDADGDIWIDDLYFGVKAGG